MPRKDPFAKASKFLKAFDTIRENGFFEDIYLHHIGKGMEGKVAGCIINVSGCIPNEKKYVAEGCGAIIDPRQIIASFRRISRHQEVKDIDIEIRSQDWPLLDKQGKNVIGSKGKRTELCLNVVFKT